MNVGAYEEIKALARFCLIVGMSYADAQELTDEERIDEIAKMLSGNKITEAAIAQANTLLGN